jgi:deazaflavin-dependent oxidoreductase (nitroreductase family)
MNDMERYTQPQSRMSGVGRDSLRRLFWYLNRFFMVPVFRLGLGSLVGSPLGGYIMVLKTTGAKTGKTRYTPLNYAILDGRVYCIAGWGTVAQWYRNLRVRPEVELLLPGGAAVGVAEEVTDPDESLRAIRQVLRNAGFVGFVAGLNPFTTTDEELRERTHDTIVIRIRPTGIGAGAADPGGWFWILSWAAHAAAGAWLLRRLRGRRGAL